MGDGRGIFAGGNLHDVSAMPHLLSPPPTHQLKSSLVARSYKKKIVAGRKRNIQMGDGLEGARMLHAYNRARHSP